MEEQKEESKLIPEAYLSEKYKELPETILLPYAKRQA